MSTKHTPTPWKEGKSSAPMTECIILSESGYVIGEVYNCQDNPENTANAAFIVRACNSHDALVEALAQCIDNLQGSGYDLSPYREVLAQAKGE